jgi:hypothetical protein
MLHLCISKPCKHPSNLSGKTIRELQQSQTIARPVEWYSRQRIYWSSHTLLLSSISALLPTMILFTLSDACSSMFLIQFLISAGNQVNSQHHHTTWLCNFTIGQKKNWQMNHSSTMHCQNKSCNTGTLTKPSTNLQNMPSSLNFAASQY